MDSFIKYENCFYCGSPIREKVFLEVDSLEEIQLPYCSQNCYESDPESEKIVEETQITNKEYNKSSLQNQFVIEKILNNPDLSGLINDKKQLDEQSFEKITYLDNGRNYYRIFWMLLGIIFIIILTIGISTNEQFENNKSSQKILNRFIILIGSVLTIALFKEIRNK
jgi:hypothetical protein